jgi:N6-adenosine-specific RNA methylase IME4
MKYDVILADPPWHYRDMKNNDPAMGGIQYRTMKNEELWDLDVASLAAKNSCLFLWATLPKLAEALKTMEKWGFRYTTTAFVWVKLNKNATILTVEFEKEVKTYINGGIYSGLGHWTNGNAEIVLFGKRGVPRRKEKNVKQLVFAPVGRHSAKPTAVHRRIERLIEGTNRLELFARQEVPGWTCVGDEITGNDIRVDLERLATDGN